MTRELRVVGRGLAPDVLARAASATALITLDEALRFSFARSWELVDVIVQDEYTHDVIVEGPAPAYLVFDTT